MIPVQEVKCVGEVLSLLPKESPMLPVQDILTIVGYLRKDTTVSVKDAIKAVRNVLNYGFDMFIGRTEPLPMHATLSSDEDAANNLEAACTMHASGADPVTGGGAVLIALLPFLLDLARKLLFK